MVDLANAKQTEVGETSPKESSKKVVDNIVDDIVQDSKLVDSKEEQKPEQPEPKPVDEKSEPEEPQDSDQSEETDEQSDDTQDEMVSKSKVQDRIDKLTARIKSLESENQKLSSKPAQSQEEKLDRLSVQELKQLRRQTKIAQRSEQDESRLEQLLDLEEKVEDKLQTYPERFQQRQVENLKSVLPELSKIDPDISSGKGELWNIAARIFQRSQTLQSSDMGQVEAAVLAAEHLSLKRSQSNAQERTSNLSKQVTNLKRKTSLEGKTRVASDKGINITKLREKARTGDLIDKENFFREALVPDEFLQI